MELIDCPSEAVRNIVYWYDEIKKYPEHEMTERLSFVRCWYACYVNMKWYFAPSKYIGYKDIDFDSYLVADDLDGKKTERVLQRFRQAPNKAQLSEIHEVMEEVFFHANRTLHINAKIFILPTGDDDGINLTTTERQTVTAIVNMVESLPSEVQNEVIRQLSC
ncbi:hypothetical protein [Cronobacter condimenti]|jgi:hypothetical protein|nr:hypothetical protein [Cronobacter condimenti]EKY3243939.1 hypothetical protein [Cronobacter dublinensis]MDV5356223.1 hypothetical protein [Enterobacter asburiae]